jgi:hypothetical protein
MRKKRMKEHNGQVGKKSGWGWTNAARMDDTQAHSTPQPTPTEVHENRYVDAEASGARITEPQGLTNDTQSGE